MNPFWKNEPLTPDELDLVAAVGNAHQQSTFRENPSSVAVSCAAQGSGDLLKSICAGLSCMGGPHAPIIESYAILSQSIPNTCHGKVPGWGSSFIKGQIDPIWKPVSIIIDDRFEEMAIRIRRITERLHAAGAMVYPNPSAFTAAAAILIGMPQSLAPYLLVMGRLSGWAELFLNATKGN